MDTFLPILTAVVGGASAGLKGVASDAVSSAYAALKGRLKDIGADAPIKEVEAAIEQGAQLQDVVKMLARDQFPEDDERLDAIIKDLCAKLDVLKAENPAVVAKIALPLPVTLSTEEKVALVKGFPIGPALRLGLLSIDRFSLAMASATSAENPAGAKRIVTNANELRVMADPALPEASICISGAPHPAFTAMPDYWYLVGEEAAQRGPRMTAALLLSCPIPAWIAYGAEAFDLLSRERDQ